MTLRPEVYPLVQVCAAIVGPCCILTLLLAVASFRCMQDHVLCSQASALLSVEAFSDLLKAML